MTDLRARAVAGARDLAGAGRVLAARRDDLGQSVTAEQPWGGDRAGRAFDQRYRAIEGQLLDAWAQLAAYVESLGDAAQRLADGSPSPSRSPSPSPSPERS